MTDTGPPAPRPPLLATKLHPPRRRRTLIARPRLTHLAERSRQRALTLVSAPAGFGKTTLVAEWFADSEGTAWLSLDQRDDDPVAFWTYVVATLDAAAPELSSHAATLLQSPGAPLDAVVSTLINDLETAAQDLVLVLDDYHLIESTDIHQSLAFLLEHLPPQIRLVIATRADPPLPLASLRASGDLLEVRAADLRFTTEEAGSYLGDAMDLALTDRDVEVLDSRTEGWIAALQLAALSMQGRSDPSSFVADFAGDDRFILDYLADEVLEHQASDVREFLLATSILPRLTGPLCAAVTGRDDARAILEHLERSNLFLIALDDRRTWYRYHHLFGDVLRARLADDHADLVPELHRRASAWYAANGEPHEAISQAVSGGHPLLAAELIERAASAMQRARQEDQLRSWLESLPPEVFDDRPVLADTLAGARMASGDPTGVEALLDLAESQLEPDQQPVVIDQAAYRQLPAMISIHRAGLSLLAGDPDGTITHATRALALAGEQDPLQRGAGSALLGLAQWSQGELVSAQERYTEALQRFEVGGYLPDAMGISLALADMQLAQGRLRDAQRTLEHALDLTVEHPGLRGAADMHVGLSEVLIERNELDRAADHLETSAELGESAGLPQHPYRRRVTTARLLRARGDLDGALSLLDEALPLYATDYSPPVRPVEALRARVQLARGDLDLAEDWARRRRFGVDDTLTYVQEFEHITFARVLVARGAADKSLAPTEHARTLLNRLLDAAEEGGRIGSTIEILVLLSALHDARDDVPAANQALGEALRRAEPEGHIRLFLHAGPAVTRLLRSIATTEGPASYAATVLAAAEVAQGAEPTARPRQDLLLDRLSDREIDVLRLLRGDLSGPDIARELHVSLNTLRTHTKHIYTKLGATNRREALTRAGELGL
ncbi:MAG: ATP-dependent transcriptional regulator, MalT-like, LuxR family [Ilumatobacteraceae bacterium]|nr:ATP-dependent transcriptional regulator, MalT-like, LuxR family [Ilumatobacteraceae bacterium]